MCMNDDLNVYPQKSKLVTFLLCWILGEFGIHRLYTGKVVSGILYLLTGGFCGVGIVIDMILILTNNFKDSNKIPLKNDIPTFVIVLLFIAWFAFDVFGVILGILKAIIAFIF